MLQNALPDLLCVVQVALEGAISKKAALNSLAQGNLPQVRCILTNWYSGFRLQGLVTGHRVTSCCYVIFFFIFTEHKPLRWALNSFALGNLPQVRYNII